MKIFVLNCGSSSLKYQLIDMETETVMAKGNYERIGEKEAFLTHKIGDSKYVIEKEAMNHDEALKIIMSQLTSKEYRVINDLSEINAIGHRIVHGGEIFDKSVLVTEDVIKKIEQCAELAPLHNPAAVLGIRACQREIPEIKMVTVFDTAFHQTMPEENYMYPIPEKYYEKYRIRKYGAHGTSHRYVANKAAELMKKNIKDLKFVTCHLGQGASLCAVQGGKSVDTSMGLTPLGGIAMVTRSGDLDPSVVTYMMEKEGISPRDMNNLLNKQSGLSGMTGLVPDFREIEKISENNSKAKMAVNKFVSIIAQYIARYAVVMQGIDAIIFTGGIGENQINVRKAICEKLAFMGVCLDEERNNIRGEERKISKDNSSIQVWLIPTNEELMIAKETMKLIEE